MNRRLLPLVVANFFLVALLPAAEPEPADRAAPKGPPVPTVIECTGQSDAISTATETTFTFRDNVTVTGNNLKLTCDLLVVIARRTGDPKATLGKQDAFKSLVATGRVRLFQNEREAWCDRAEVLPGEDKATLTGNPARVRSADGKYEGSGPEILLLRGEQKALIRGGSRFVLPEIKDLGPKAKDKDKKSSPPEEPAPKVVLPK